MKEDFEYTKREYRYKMRCYTNMLNIRWHQKVTNDDSMRRQVNRTEIILDIIRRKKLTLFGHVCRMPNNRLVKNVLLGYMKGVRRRGRQPKRWTADNITEWTGLGISESRSWSVEEEIRNQPQRSMTMRQRERERERERDRWQWQWIYFTLQQ